MRSHVARARRALKSAMMKFLTFLALFITRAQFLGIVNRGVSGSPHILRPLGSAATQTNRRYYLVWERAQYFARTGFDEFIDASKADHRLGTTAETRKSD